MNPISISDFNLAPDLIIGSEEHRKLTLLAMTGEGHTDQEADWLLYELDRARLVPDVTVPINTVRMGSRVRFRTTGGGERAVTLVFPKEADIAAGKVSVLTPIGAALIGLRRGQSITWQTRDGRKQVLTVVDVLQPRDGPRPAA